MILIPVWTFFLLGARHGVRAAGIATDTPRLLIGAACFTAVAGAAYIVNQISDRETDRRAGKLFLIPHGIISLPAAWAEAALLTVLSFATAALTMPGPFLMILAAGALLGAAYSMEPVRLKRRPVLDVLANALANGVINTLAGWTAVGAPLDGIEALAPYPVAVAAVHLSTTLADVESDREAGLMTSGVLIGRRRGIALSSLLMGSAFAVAAVLRNTPALIASGISLLFFFAAASSERRKGIGDGILMPAKVSTLAFSLAAVFFFPLYGAFLAAVIILTRVYYSKRFGIRYPSL